MGPARRCSPVEVSAGTLEQPHGIVAIGAAALGAEDVQRRQRATWGDLEDRSTAARRAVGVVPASFCRPVEVSVGGLEQRSAGALGFSVRAIEAKQCGVAAASALPAYAVFPQVSLRNALTIRFIGPLLFLGWLPPLGFPFGRDYSRSSGGTGSHRCLARRTAAVRVWLRQASARTSDPLAGGRTVRPLRGRSDRRPLAI